jgi:hypothetical protein
MLLLVFSKIVTWAYRSSFGPMEVCLICVDYKLEPKFSLQ